MGWFRWNLLNTLQSRAFSCKLTSCLIHAAKLVQTHAKPCKVPPGFLATSRGYLVKSVQQLDKNGVFRSKSHATCYFLSQREWFRICTFFHQFAHFVVGVPTGRKRGVSYRFGTKMHAGCAAQEFVPFAPSGNHYPKQKPPGLSSGGAVSCDAYAAGITRWEENPA